MMDYTINETNLHIENSYAYWKSEMLPTLHKICFAHPTSHVWRRSDESLIAEWTVHNALYRLHVMRSHTADVDLNFPQRFDWLYRILASLASLIIK